MARPESIVQPREKTERRESALERKPVIMGEIRVDALADGTEAVGGQAFNIVWHLRGLGLDPLFITRVGEDAVGKKVVNALRSWGVDISGVQTGDSLPTTARSAAGSGDHPVQDAFTHLDPDIAVNAMKRITPTMLFHRTTAMRTEGAQKTLQKAKARLGAPVFLDMDLSPAWLTAQDHCQALFGARWARIDANDLLRLTGSRGYSRMAVLSGPARQLVKTFALDALFVDYHGLPVVVTAGEESMSFRGAFETPEGGSLGRRDAAAAGLLLGLIAGLPLTTLVQRVNDLAHSFGAPRGNLSADPELYRELQKRWAADSARKPRS
jgi:fructokinase